MIVLSGANTDIGQSLLPVLRDKHQVCSFNNEQGDIRDVQFITRMFEEVNPEFFINCSQVSNYEECEINRELTYNYNSFPLREISKLCKKMDVKLVQLSTSYVFDGKKNTPYDESDKVNPCSAFGDSKALAEKFIMESGCEYIILRTPLLFGKNNNLIKDIIKNLESNQAIDVISNHNINPTCLKDLAEVINLMVINNLSGIYHFSNDNSVNYNDFIFYLMELYNSINKSNILAHVHEIDIKDYISTFEPVLNDTLDNSKIKSHLGITVRDWKLALEEYLSLLIPAQKN